MKLVDTVSHIIAGVREKANAVLPRVQLVAVDNGDSARKASVFTEGCDVLDVRDRTNGQSAVPAIILVKDDGEVLTGFAAERLAELYPDRIIRNWKPATGTDEVVATIDGIPRRAAWCNEQMMRDAVAAAAVPLGKTPKACVLTHKGDATQAHLDELRASAESLGLEVVAMVAESTAAVYGYDGFEKGKRYVAVSDWGSSTHDLTILDVSVPESLKVVAVVGTPAGGTRVTNELMERCIDGFAAQLGFLPLVDSTPGPNLALRTQCEQAKLAFAVADTGLVVVRDGERSFQKEFSLAEFLECVEMVENEVFSAIEAVLSEKGIRPEEIHWVGAGRAIRTRGHLERFEQRFGKLHCDLDSDTAISRGALLYAAKVLSEQGRGNSFENLPASGKLAALEDVNHRAFGVVINRWKAPREGPIPLRECDIDPSKTYRCLDAVLDRWQPVGQEKVITYSPSYREQEHVEITLAEGPQDGALPSECQELGTFELGLVQAPGRDGVGRIEVRIRVDAKSKCVSVSARDKYDPDGPAVSGTVRWTPAPRPSSRAIEGVR